MSSGNNCQEGGFPSIRRKASILLPMHFFWMLRNVPPKRYQLIVQSPFHITNTPTRRKIKLHTQSIDRLEVMKALTRMVFICTRFKLPVQFFDFLFGLCVSITINVNYIYIYICLSTKSRII